MSLLSGLASNPVLLEYAQNASQRHLQPVGNFLAPTVPVSAVQGRYKIFTAKNRFKLPDTRRAPGGTAARIGFSAEDGTYNCQPHAIDVPLDQQEIAEAGEVGMNAAMEAADLAAEVAALEHEKSAIDLALTTAGAGTNVNVNAVDPVDQIDTFINNVRLAAPGGSGMVNRILFGPTAWRLFKNCTAVRSRFVAAGSKAIPNVSIEMARTLFVGNPEIMESEMVYDTTDEGQTASYAFLLASAVLVFRASSNPTRTDSSALKTFRQMGRWLGPRAYTTTDGRGEVFGFDWSRDIKAVNSSAILRLNFSAA